MKNLTKIIPIILGVTVSLVPLVIVPFFTDIHDFGKQIFLLLAGLLIFILWTLKSFSEKKIVFPKSKYLLPIFAFFVGSLISTIINSPLKIASSLATAGGVTIFLCLLFYIYIQSLAKLKTVLLFFLGSGLVLAIINLVLTLGILRLPINLPSLNLSITNSFSPLGNLISQTVFLAVLIPIGFALSYHYLQEKKTGSAVAVFIAAIIILAGIGMSVNLLAGSAKPIILSFSVAWSIAVEGLKTAKSALWGVGPGRFSAAFVSLRPISFNASPYWNLRFGSAVWFLQILSEVGIVGLLAYSALIWQIAKSGVKLIRENKPSPLALAIIFSLAFLTIIQFYIPFNFSLIFLFFCLVGLFDMAVKQKEENAEMDIAPLGPAAYVFLIFPVVFWGAVLYFAGKTSLASVDFLNSLKAAANNDGTQTYNLQIKAIQTDPWSPAYRIGYSQTNFALANSLAAKKDLSENDRNTVSQLVQQSLREARAAVSLDPSNIASWENLANLYRNLINFAQEADQWTIATYQEAIKLDPLNPQLRLDLGGVYFGQKNYNQAALFFNQATQLKPDLANAHYNLANALREANALVDAKREYEITQSLIKADSADWQKVTSELEEVKKKLPAPTPAASEASPETLSKPKPPAKGIKPPLDLPDEGPPVTSGEEEVSPTVQPQP